VEVEVKTAANERACQIARADLDMNLVKIRCTKDEELRRVESQIEPKRRAAELQIELNKLEAVKQEVWTYQNHFQVLPSNYFQALPSTCNANSHVLNRILAMH
jgi:hypothetical protein